MDRTHTACFIAQRLIAPFPNAKAHLKHYIKGTGEAIEVNLEEIWKQDSGLRNLFSFRVRPMIQRAAPSGSLIVPQIHLHNWNWRLALGSMTYTWSFDGSTLTIGGLTTYKWSPNESRITRPLHEELNKLSRQGASSYQITGKPFSMPIQSLPTVCTLPKLPVYRRLYL